MNKEEIVTQRLKNGIKGMLINSPVSDRIYFYPDIGNFSITTRIQNVCKMEDEER